METKSEYYLRYDICKSRYFTVNNYDQNYVCELYDKYTSGQILHNDWAQFMCAYMSHYAVSLLRKMGRLEHGEYNDMMQNIYVAVIENLDKYNPHLYTPTAFFTCYMLQASKADINIEIPKYIKDTITKLDKIAKKGGFEGLLDPSLDIVWLVMESNVSMKTIQESIRINGYVRNSFEALLDSNAGAELLPSSHETPEDVVIKKTQKEKIHELLSNLSPLEKFLIDILTMNPRNPIETDPRFKAERQEELKKKELHGMNTEPSLELKAPSFKQIVSMFKNHEKLREMFADDLPPKYDSKFFELLHKKAIRKLRNLPEFRKYITAEGVRTRFEAQAEDEDIVNAFNIDEL